jgi:hypothetical protein
MQKLDLSPFLFPGQIGRVQNAGAYGWALNEVPRADTRLKQRRQRGRESFSAND